MDERIERMVGLSQEQAELVRRCFEAVRAGTAIDRSWTDRVSEISREVESLAHSSTERQEGDAEARTLAGNW